MKDDLPRFPTPMEAFGQGKRKHTSAAFDTVGDIPKPPLQQRYRQKPATSSPSSSSPVNTPPVNQYYAPQVLPQSCASTPQHYQQSNHTPASLGVLGGPSTAHQGPENAHAAHMYQQQGQAPAMGQPRTTPPHTSHHQQISPRQQAIQQQLAQQQYAQQQLSQQQMASQITQQQMGQQQVGQHQMGHPGHHQQQVPYVPRVSTAPPAQSVPQFTQSGVPYSRSNPALPQGAPVPFSAPPGSATKPSRRPVPEPARQATREPALTSDATDLRSLFDEVDRKRHGYLTERELSKALVNGDYTLFDAHTVRLMMKMFDRDGDGAIYFAEFGQLWKYLHEWRQVFDRFDTSRSDTIDLDEFSRALAAFGYSLSVPCVHFMFNAGSKLSRQGVREMSFDMFVQSCISIKSITDTFKRYDTDRDGFVTMSFEDFLTETTKLH